MPNAKSIRRSREFNNNQVINKLKELNIFQHTDKHWLNSMLMVCELTFNSLGNIKFAKRVVYKHFS